MRFIEAEIEECRRCQNKNLEQEFEKFMSMNVKTAKVIFTEEEYSCSNAVAVVLRRGVKTHRLPIHVLVVNGNVYLVRRDM